MKQGSESVRRDRSMHTEIRRRASATSRILELFRSCPNVWVPWTDLAHIGGALAWRTRVSDARRQLRKDGGDILWNGDPKYSAYMYRPHRAIGPSAETFRELRLF